MSASSNRSRAAGILAAALVILAASSMPALVAQEEAPADPTPQLEKRVHRGQLFSMFQDIDVPLGEIRSGEVVCIFGDVRIDGEVTGEVVAIAGNVRVSGKVRQELVGVLSSIVLEEGAEIDGDLVNVGGTLEDRSGKIGGDYINVNIPFHVGPLNLGAPFGAIGVLIAWGVLIWLVLVFVLVVILVAVAPERVRVLSDEIPASLPLAYLAGLGAYVTLLIVSLLLVSTVIGIPLAFLLYVVFLLLKWLGLSGIFHHVGRGIGRLFGTELSLLGAVLLGMSPFAVLLVLPPVIGGIGLLIAVFLRLFFWLAVEIPAIGLVILTAAGGRRRMQPSWAPPPAAAGK